MQGRAVSTAALNRHTPGHPGHGDNDGYPDHGDDGHPGHGDNDGYPAKSHRLYSQLLEICHNVNWWQCDSFMFIYHIYIIHDDVNQNW